MNDIVCILDLLIGHVTDWLKEEALCLNSLSGICTSDSKCCLLHSNFEDVSYLWQVHTPGGSEWSDVKESVNTLIERAFRNPNSDEWKVG